MRKVLISATQTGKNDPALRHEWLQLEQAARVEVTSEAKDYPVEGALLTEGKRGWRANEAGIQTIRLLFDHPQTIQVIRLVYREVVSARTQEFVLRWLPWGTGVWEDVVRQQWNFSPPITETEWEEYNVNLLSAAALELTIQPNIGGGETRASLESLQLSVQ